MFESHLLSSASSQRKLFSILVPLVATVMAGIMGEICLRLLGYHGEPSLMIQNTMLVDDAVLNWRYIPNTVSYSNEIIYQVNERGFRDLVYPFQKPSSVFRIFLASDSVGFGTNVQMEESYPKLLEHLLNEMHLGVKVEVVNYSLPGLSLKQKFHLIKLHAQEYNPDLVILDYVVNDVEFESRKNPDKEKTMTCSIALLRLPVPCFVEESFKRSAFLFFLKQAADTVLRKLHWEDKNHFYQQVESDYYHRLYVDPKRRQYLHDVFQEIGEYQHTLGIQILMPIFPLIYNFQQYKWLDINEMITKLCQDNNVPFVSLLAEYQKFDYDEMRVQRGDFTHPSIKGNQIAAEAVARAVVQLRH